MTVRWYVVHSQPSAEGRALYHLSRQGFTAYMPRYLKMRRHARRVDYVARPLFPRYLFVAVDLGIQRWRSILSTFGVSRIVCDGDNPVPVPEGIVESIQRREDAQGLVPAGSGLFKAGEAVEITAGAMAGVRALFDCIGDQERAVLLLNLMGRQVRVKVPLHTVATASYA